MTFGREVCLYGGHHAAGYIAVDAGGRCHGDGEQRLSSFNAALWLACADLRRAGVAGKVRVFAAGGRLMAEADVERPGYYGDLLWRRAPVYAISAADVVAAAEKAG